MSLSNIAHISISAPREQFDSVVGWYKAALAPFKYRELRRIPKAVGLGSELPDLWVVQDDVPTQQRLHFALMAPGILTLQLLEFPANHCRLCNSGRFLSSSDSGRRYR